MGVDATSCKLAGAGDKFISGFLLIDGDWGARIEGDLVC